MTQAAAGAGALQMKVLFARGINDLIDPPVDRI